MFWCSGVSTEEDFDEAMADACEEVADQLDGRSLDLVFVFVSSHHWRRWDEVPRTLRQFFGDDTAILGSSAGAVIGDGHELEGTPAISILGAHLPLARIRTFHVAEVELPRLMAQRRGWSEKLEITPAEEPSFILLPDPFTCDVGALLHGLDQAYPGAPKVGGLASGGTEPGSTALFQADHVHHQGAVGVALSGNVKVETLVAQGCRPIGSPMFVTRTSGNLILELDGRAPAQVLADLDQTLPEADRHLFRSGLLLGIVMNERQESYRPGDFLIRNVLGFEPNSGGLAIGAVAKDRTVVQFHLRDARASSLDLNAVLEQYAQRTQFEPPASVLMFSCLGRGQGLYGEPDHDAHAVLQHLGEGLPLGGFFGNGEIGPVHQKTFLHGYTAALALFFPRMVH